MSLTKPIFAEALIAPAHLFEAIAGDYLFLCFYISVILETYSAKAIGHTESMYTRRSGFISFRHYDPIKVLAPMEVVG